MKHTPTPWPENGAERASCHRQGGGMSLRRGIRWGVFLELVAVAIALACCYAAAVLA